MVLVFRAALFAGIIVLIVYYVLKFTNKKGKKDDGNKDVEQNNPNRANEDITDSDRGSGY